MQKKKKGTKSLAQYVLWAGLASGARGGKNKNFSNFLPKTTQCFGLDGLDNNSVNEFLCRLTLCRLTFSILLYSDNLNPFLYH